MVVEEFIKENIINNIILRECFELNYIINR